MFGAGGRSEAGVNTGLSNCSKSQDTGLELAVCLVLLNGEKISFVTLFRLTTTFLETALDLSTSRRCGRFGTQCDVVSHVLLFLPSLAVS